MDIILFAQNVMLVGTLKGSGATVSADIRKDNSENV
jgi:hypothetical protein